MRIITRAEWGANDPTDPFIRMRTPSPRVYIHHTGTDQHGAAGMRAIQRFHQDVRGWKDIAYNFVIDSNGDVFEGRGAGIIGGATEGQNSTSHAVCLMGNFNVVSVTSAARRSLVDLLRDGAAYSWWRVDLLGHQQAPGANTSCPGTDLFRDLPFIELAARAPSVPVPPPIPIPTLIQEDDMFTYATGGKPTMFCSGGRSVGLNEATDLAEIRDKAADADVPCPHFALDAETYAAFKAAFPSSG